MLLNTIDTGTILQVRSCATLQCEQIVTERNFHRKSQITCTWDRFAKEMKIKGEPGS